MNFQYIILGIHKLVSILNGYIKVNGWFVFIASCAPLHKRDQKYGSVSMTCKTDAGFYVKCKLLDQAARKDYNQICVPVRHVLHIISIRIGESKAWILWRSCFSCFLMCYFPLLAGGVTYNRQPSEAQPINCNVHEYQLLNYHTS